MEIDLFMGATVFAIGFVTAFAISLVQGAGRSRDRRNPHTNRTRPRKEEQDE